jgi:predicted amidohydrolase YtcJ
MRLCSTPKELAALQMAEVKQDMPLNTTCGTPASAATRRVNPRKKSETSVSGWDGSDGMYVAKGSHRSAVAWRNARWSDGNYTTACWRCSYKSMLATGWNMSKVHCNSRHKCIIASLNYSIFSQHTYKLT